jgi:membrane protease YdiL (CAAX protease family)
VAERRATVFLLLGMVAWVAAGFVAAAGSAVAFGFAVGLIFGSRGYEIVAGPSEFTYILIGAWTFQIVLLVAAFRQGRLAGNGDRSAGLGWRPVRRKGRVLLLCVAIIIWLLVFVLLAASVPALREFVKSVTPDVLSGMRDSGAMSAFLRVGLVAVLAPVSEELFFRGWLWEALRRRGHAIAMTACLTGAPWLLLHGIDSPGRILVLIPAAVIISLARYFGGGVRASLMVHVANNGAAVLMQTLSALFGHGE